MFKKTKVTVVGSGYVGMSLAVLLAQQNDVTVLDIDPERVGVNRRESTVADPDIETFLKEKELSLSATLDVDEAYSGADFVVVATPPTTTLTQIGLTRGLWILSPCKLRYWLRTPW